ncbi:MAG: Sensor protein ZraS [Alphaproteobacteria bacterium MarineAlpha8_Bin1]|nr:MAG: Sensor protein ZraS [Alphaproteobacteria bacterium MarineAlpha8_Bin1]
MNNFFSNKTFFLKNEIQNFIFILIFIISFSISLIIFLMLSGYLSDLQNEEKISSLLSVNFSMIIILIIISLDKIIKIFFFKKNKIKSNLRIQFTSLFLIITFIPTTIVTVFSLIFFDQGVKLWFNDKLNQVIKGSKNISESYFSEHTQSIKNDILYLNTEINNEKIVFFTDKTRLSELLSYFVEIKDLQEAIIFERSGQLLAKVGSFFIESEPAPPLWARYTADDGDIAVFTNEDRTKVRALLKLQRAIPTYLSIGKNVDSNVLSRVESVNQAAIEYNNIEKKIDHFQNQFNKLFLAINFLMILLAIWFGLKFSNKIIDPIMEIILASEKIIKGDLTTRIRNFKGYYDFNVLSKVLNKMLDNLNEQKNKLIKAKETINLRRKFTEKIINDVSTGIISIDLKYRILLFNKKAKEIFGNKFNKDFFKRDSEIKNFIKKFQDESLNSDQTQIKYLANEKLKILNLKVSSEFEKSKMKGYIINIDDVTELVSAQKNAAWSNVARYMAHEIKNPLTPIKLSAQRIENFFNNKKKIDEETFINCTNTIVRQVNNIESLVTEFSNFARMPSGNFQDTKLNNIIQTQINSQKLVFKNAKFDYSISNQNLIINCDYNQLSRVFLNLFKNSLESITSKKKIITVNVTEEKKFILIEISDNGVGFPKDSDNLFEPYVTNKADGTGLGLSICKKIIEDHGGEISLHANEKYKGALVKLKFLRKRI